MKPTQITDTFSVSPQLSPQDIALAKAAGFSTVICNRPDGEEFGQPSAEMIRAACDDNDMTFHYVPMSASGPGATTLADFKAAVGGAKGRILAYCRSGNRSSMLWKATRG